MTRMSELTGKHVVVTGGTGALGGAVVALLIERGATVHLPMIEPELPAQLAWRTDRRVVAAPGLALDDEAAVTGYYAKVPAPWASIHLVGGFAMAPITETSLADYEKMHRLNGVTCFLTCREAVRAMRKAGGGGRIVNVASRAVLTPAGGSIAYTASKAEVSAITAALAAEVLAEGILVNAVVPSIIDTPANRASMPTADHARWPKAADIAEAIAYLASPSNTLTSGALLPVYGRG